MIYVSIDIETTGIDPLKNSITQFAAVIDDIKNPYPIDHLPKFNYYIKGKNRIWDKEILSFGRTKEIAKIIKEDGENVITEEELIPKFVKFLSDNLFTKDKNGCYWITAAGKNFGAFDHQFIKRLPHYGKEVRILHRSFDPAVLFLNPKIDDKIPDMNTCLIRAGIDKKVAHDAEQDAIDVICLIRYFFCE